MNMNLQGPFTVTTRVKNGCLKRPGGLIRSRSIAILHWKGQTAERKAAQPLILARLSIWNSPTFWVQVRVHEPRIVDILTRNDGVGHARNFRKCFAVERAH